MHAPMQAAMHAAQAAHVRASEAVRQNTPAQAAQLQAAQLAQRQEPQAAAKAGTYLKQYAQTRLTPDATQVAWSILSRSITRALDFDLRL